MELKVTEKGQRIYRQMLKDKQRKNQEPMTRAEALERAYWSTVDNNSDQYGY